MLSLLNAYVHDPERRSAWVDILGTDEIPVLSPIPFIANLPDKENALCYEVNIKALNSDQLTRLILHLADKFDLDTEDVRRSIANEGVPILANDVTVMGSIPWWL